MGLCQERTVTSVWEAGSRASGSPFSAEQAGGRARTRHTQGADGPPAEDEEWIEADVEQLAAHGDLQRRHDVHRAANSIRRAHGALRLSALRMRYVRDAGNDRRSSGRGATDD